MPIQVECKCGNEFGAPSKYAGKKVKCPKCSDPLVVPQSNGKEKQNAATTGKAIPVKCACGKSFAAKPELKGKTVRCPSCKEPLKVGAPGKPATSAGPEKASFTEDAFADIGLRGSEEGGPGRKCPECRKPMGPEDILCINCGYNERLGRKMDVQRPVTQQDRDKAHLDKRLTGEKPEKKKRGWFSRKKK